MKLHKDLREFIALLNSHKVDYVIVGAFALAFHGRPRNTGYLDILVRCSHANAAKIESALQAFGFGRVGITAADFAVANHIVQLGRPPHRIDLITSLTGVEFAEIWDSRVASDLDGLPVSFIGLDSFVKNKKATDRTQDRADLEALGIRD